MAIEGLETRGDLERFISDTLSRSPQGALLRQVQGAAAQQELSIWAGGSLGASLVTGSYLMTPALTGTLAGTAAAGAAAAAFWLDPAELKGSSRIRWMWHVGATGPGVAVVLGLYPVTGFLNTTVTALGPAVVTNTPSLPANDHGHVDSADFTIPAAGFYALAASPQATTAAGSNVMLSALMMRRAS